MAQSIKDTSDLASPVAFTFTPPLEHVFAPNVVRNRASVLQTALTDIDTTLQLFQVYPHLQVDFQFILTADGHLGHVDLDRLFEVELTAPAWQSKFFQHAVPSLQHFKQQLVAILGASLE